MFVILMFDGKVTHWIFIYFHFHALVVSSWTDVERVKIFELCQS